MEPFHIVLLSRFTSYRRDVETKIRQQMKQWITSSSTTIYKERKNNVRKQFHHILLFSLFYVVFLSSTFSFLSSLIWIYVFSSFCGQWWWLWCGDRSIRNFFFSLFSYKDKAEKSVGSNSRCTLIHYTCYCVYAMAGILVFAWVNMIQITKVQYLNVEQQFLIQYEQNKDWTADKRKWCWSKRSNNMFNVWVWLHSSHHNNAYGCLMMISQSHACLIRSVKAYYYLLVLSVWRSAK